MKKIVYILLLCLPMLSCQDASSLMDKEDVGDLYEKDVFRSGTYARYFVNDIYYNIISTGYGVSGWGGAYMALRHRTTARPAQLNSAAHRYNTGNWNAADNPLGFIWTNSYAQIRACNKFLENYHLIEEESGITTRLDIEYLRAQVIFLRAYFYSELLRAFGGVPLITKVLSMDDPEIKSERDSFKTILDFIVGECENAAELLKSLRGEDATRYGLFGGNFGRANEGIALALKAKVLLMAASPLFNRPADFSQYDSADPNVSLWRYPDYDGNVGTPQPKRSKTLSIWDSTIFTGPKPGPRRNTKRCSVSGPRSRKPSSPTCAVPASISISTTCRSTSCLYAAREPRYATHCPPTIW